MTEGKVWLCGWEQTPTAVRVWVLDQPALAAEGSTFEEADEALWGEICEKTGDCESIREYAPLQPNIAEEPWTLPQLVTVAGQESIEVLNADELFEDGYCPMCAFPRGPRSSVPVAVESVKAGGGYVSIRVQRRMGPMIKVFSASFVELLDDSNCVELEWRKVETRRRSAPSFELVSRAPPIPFIVHRRRTDPIGQCKACGTIQRPLPVLDGGPLWYIAVAEIPKPTPDCFAIGESTAPQLCLRRDRWSQLVKLSGAKGLKSNPVGVASPEDVIADPPIEIRTSF